MDVLQCEVCRSYMGESSRWPRVLNCGHTLCSHCAHRFLINGKLECIDCSASHSAKSVVDIPLNYTVIKIINSNLAKIPPGSLIPPTLPEDIEELSNQMFDKQNDNGNYSCGSSVGPEPVYHAGICEEHDQYFVFWCACCKTWVCHDCVLSKHWMTTCPIISFHQALNGMKYEEDQKIKSAIATFDAQVVDIRQKHQAIRKLRAQHRQMVKDIGALVSQHQSADRALEKEDSKIQSSLNEGLGICFLLLESQGNLLEARTLKEVEASRTSAEKCKAAMLNWFNPYILHESIDTIFSDEILSATRRALLALKETLESSKHASVQTAGKGLLRNSAENQDLGNVGLPALSPSQNQYFGNIGHPTLSPSQYQYLGNIGHPTLSPSQYQYLGNLGHPTLSPSQNQDLGNIGHPKYSPSQNKDLGNIGYPKSSPSQNQDLGQPRLLTLQQREEVLVDLGNINYQDLAKKIMQNMPKPVSTKSLLDEELPESLNKTLKTLSLSNTDNSGTNDDGKMEQRPSGMEHCPGEEVKHTVEMADKESKRHIGSVDQENTKPEVQNTSMEVLSGEDPDEEEDSICNSIEIKDIGGLPGQGGASATKEIPTIHTSEERTPKPKIRCRDVTFRDEISEDTKELTEGEVICRGNVQASTGEKVLKDKGDDVKENNDEVDKPGNVNASDKTDENKDSKIIKATEIVLEYVEDTDKDKPLVLPDNEKSPEKDGDVEIGSNSSSGNESGYKHTWKEMLKVKEGEKENEGSARLTSGKIAKSSSFTDCKAQ